MRALLGVSVLLTVAVAWATGAAPAGQARAVPADLPVRSDDAPAAAYEEEDTDIAGDRPICVEISTGSDRWAPVDVAEIPSDGSWISLELRIVDGETGDPEKARKASILAQSSPPPGAAAVPTWRSATHVRRGGWVAVDATLSANPGHVPDDGGAYRVSSYVSRRAERVRLVAPLRREADVLVRVLDAGGRAVEDARVKGVTFGGREPELSAVGPFEVVDVGGEVIPFVEPWPVPFVAGPTDVGGWTRIRGIPHLLDERCWIVAGVEDHENYTDLTLGAFGAPHATEIRLPEAPSWVLPPQPMGRGGRGGRRNLKTVCGDFRPARLEVVVFRRSGDSAAGLAVALGGERGTTDEYGRVVFEGLRPCTYDLDVRDPDFVWSRASVELRDGERRLVEIVEPEGWTARATLLDSLGRRVPFAAVGVSSESSVAYVRVEDGAQELGFWTDANGEIELPRMHHAPLTLRFRYGSRKKSVTIEERDPYATVRLPPP